MIKVIKEGQICWLPGLQIADLPEKLPAGISIHSRSGVIGLESQGVVGAFPLKNNDTVHITPKIGDVNFFRLLLKAEGNQLSLENEFENFVHFSSSSGESVSSLVALRLFVCLDEILRKSPLQGRIKNYRKAEYATGEIEAIKTALNIAMKQPQPVVSRVKQRTVNIPENRILTEALLRAWVLINEDSREKFESIYYRWINKFPRSKFIHRDLLEIEKSFASNSYGGSRDYYRQSLMISKIILGSCGIALNSLHDVAGDAALLNAADIFEKYIRNVIVTNYAEKGYVVTKGGAGLQSLYTDGSFELIPDIVISRGDKVTLIADAKYKKPTAADHYQMASYLAAHRIKRGALIAPLFSGKIPVVKEFSTPEKTIVREIYLPMDD
jgi:hypothetical protein